MLLRLLGILGRVIKMKQYKVQITDKALADMAEVYNYIAYVLQSPENTLAQYIGKLRDKKPSFIMRNR